MSNFVSDHNLVHMRQQLERARSFASPQVSDFAVGAVVVGETVYGAAAMALGANLELPGFPLACTVHAEQAALHRAALSGFRRVHELWVTEVPCGHCRQFMLELVPEQRPAIHVMRAEGVDRYELHELIPHPFDASSLHSRPAWLAGNEPRTPLLEQHWTSLQEAAQSAHAQSHAPYTGNRAGVALRWAEGAIDLGMRIESVAFNPSLWAFFAALSTAAMRGQAICAADLKEVTLIENASRAAEAALVRAVLGQWAPHVNFEAKVIES